MGPSAALKQLNLSIDTQQPAGAAGFARQLLDASAALQQAVLASLTHDASRQELIEPLRELVEAARVVQLDAVAEDLRAVQLLLQRKAGSDEARQEQRDDIEAAFERIGALLSLEADREPTPTSGPVRAAAFHPPLTSGASVGRQFLAAPAVAARTGGVRVVMLVERALSEGLTSADWSATDEQSLHVERAADVERARAALAAGEADVLVIDTRLDGGRALLEEVLGELHAVPVIALAALSTHEDASELLVLGAARVLATPHDPAELRQACLEVGPSLLRGTEPLGEVSMDGLGVRLASELQRGLCDAVDDRNRRRLVDYDSGAEILTTLWEAVARIRELVTAKSAGAVRFANDGSSLAALPRAQWLSRPRVRRAADRAAGGDHEVRAAEALRLDGFSVLVAEDDPSTNWFLSGVLREAGATVIEAMDGAQALLRAYGKSPDLVLADVVMPEVSGLRVCQAIKRDVVLHAAPVLLLSWKRDMLQRLRELDVGADGYLLKEASATEITQRACEVLRPYAAIAMRLRAEGAVRGRMDALGAHALLRLVCRERPEARLTLRDAHHLYAVEIRGGRPVAATMTDEPGATLRGPKVLWSMLGVRGGRFGVEAAQSDAPQELEGSLDELLAQPIARARAAQRLLSGRALMGIKRVELAAEHVKARSVATPEPALGVLRALAAGTSPRELIAARSAASSWVERVLSDAARYGAVNAVIGEQGQDLLEPGVALQLDVLQGKKVILDDPGGTAAAEMSAEERAARAEEHLFGAEEPFDEDVEDADAEMDAGEAIDEASASEEASLSGDRALAADEDHEGAVRMPERTSETGEGHALMAALVERDSELPQQARREHGHDSEPSGHTPVLATRVHAPADRVVVSHHASAREALPSAPLPEPVEKVATAPAPREEIASEPPAPERRAPRKPREPNAQVTLPSDYRSRYAPREQPKGMSRYAVPIMFALVGLAIAITARWWREQPSPPPASQPAAQPQVQQLAPPVAQPPPAPTAAPTAEPADEPLGGAQNDLPVELPLTPAEQKKLKKGEGMLEVVVGRNDKVYVDGKLIGRGSVVKEPLKGRAKPYEIKVKMRGEERVRYVVVKPDVRTRLRIAPPWAR